MAITLSQAKALKPGNYIHHVDDKNADGTPRRWRVTGRPKTWKTRPDEVRVPLKYGLRGYDSLTEHDLNQVNLGYGS